MIELEHEHADHPTYMFPVAVRRVGKRPAVIEEHDHSWCDETHALIYTDSYIAVTMYEYCYAAWYLSSGQMMGGSLWEMGEYELAVEAREEIRRRTHK